MISNGPTEKQTHNHLLFSTQEYKILTSSLFLFFTPTATAVPWLGPGRIADVFTPLRGVWESLRRVLPGQRPLLRLGRHRVLQILSYRQEVGACTHTPNKPVTFIYAQRGFAEPACCSAFVLPSHTHLGVISAPAVGFKCFRSRATQYYNPVSLTSDLHWLISKVQLRQKEHGRGQDI